MPGFLFDKFEMDVEIDNEDGTISGATLGAILSLGIGRVA